ncbi:MAG: Amuc_1100 family pilus-like protein, partial [Verrucomicrobiota bacterium]|nr:Amuc_1100 family pilus-like protein [Verrucomicrobiota bacterium]
ALYFVWSARGSFNDAQAQFEQNATELTRLQRLTPFPTDVNLRKMKTQAEDYASDLKTRVLPVVPMAPNEFQSRLRQAMTAIGERARANKVKLPENFFLGFDEFAAALPDTAAAPLLGQQLAQVELLLNIIIDARIDALTAFRRVPPNETFLPAVTAVNPAAAAPRRGPSPAAASATIERSAVEATIVGQPGATRRILNQIASANQQFYVVRTLHVLNEKDKGPARDAAGGATTAAAPSPNALNFIVGSEKVQVVARVEMLRFP